MTSRTRGRGHESVSDFQDRHAPRVAAGSIVKLNQCEKTAAGTKTGIESRGTFTLSEATWGFLFLEKFFASYKFTGETLTDSPSVGV